MPQSLLERLLAQGTSRLQSNGNAFLSGDVTLQQGTNVTLTQLGQVITVNASLAALTRLRANASPYISGDITFSGGGVSQLGNTITIAGGGLPSPYTATLVTYESVANSLLITGPSGAYNNSQPPSVVVRGRDNTDGSPDGAGGDVYLVAGNLPAGSGSGNGGGFARVMGGNAPIPGPGWITGGLTTEENGTAGNASIFGRSGADHTTLTDVNGGSATVYGGDGKGTGSGGSATVQGGGGLNPGPGYLIGGNASGGNNTGGFTYCLGGVGNGSGAGGSCSVVGGQGGSTGSGGALQFAGGASTGGTSKAGGSVTIDGGAASGTTGVGGSVSLTGGTGTATGGAVGMAGGSGPVGGGLYCVAGDSSGANTGGSASYLGGSGGSTGNGGSALLGGGASGSGGTSKVGGSATVQGGSGTGTTGIGGDGVVAGGTGTGTGGDVRLTPGGGAGGTFGRTVVTRGDFCIEDGAANCKQRAITAAAITTASTSPSAVVWSFPMPTNWMATVTVSASGDNGTTNDNTVYKACFRRGAGSAATSHAATDAGLPAFKNGHAIQIALNSNTIEAKLVPGAATSTKWVVTVGVEERSIA